MKKDRMSSYLLGAIVVAVALLLVIAFVRYYRYRAVVVEELSKKDDIVEKFGGELTKPSVAGQVPPSNLQDPQVPTQNTGQPTGLRETTEGAFQVKKSYTEHGREVVVRSAGDAAAYQKAGMRFPEREPNWDEPFQLSYQGLRKVFLYLRLYDKWPREVIEQMNGAAVTISGLVMPTGKVPQDGTMLDFWLANPIVVMAGCVFCNPPTLADLIHVETMAGSRPLKVDREQLYTDTVPVTVTGRLFFGYRKTKEGVESLFRIEMRDWRIITR